MSYPQQPGSYGQQPQYGQQNYGGQPQYGYNQQPPGQAPGGFGPGASRPAGNNKVLAIVALVVAVIHFIFWLIGFVQNLGALDALSQYGGGGAVFAFWVGALLTIAVDGLLVFFAARMLTAKP